MTEVTNGQADEPDERGDPLIDARMPSSDAEKVVGELVGALSRTQQHRDEFVRVVAAAAVGITASLIAALDESGTSGAAAVGLAFASLAAVLASFWTAEHAIRDRLGAARECDWRSTEPEEWFWNRATNWLNFGATIVLCSAGGALAIFVVTHS